MPTQLPIAAAPATPLPANTNANAGAAVGADVAVTTADVDADTQTFMTMLTQLMDEGAVVVAAPPTQAAQLQANGSKKSGDAKTDAELLSAAAVDESLLALLLPSQAPTVPTSGVTDVDSLDGQRRSTAESLPLLAANAATLQKAAGTAAADGAKVTLEFQTTLNAQSANALLNGMDKNISAEAIDADALLSASESADRLYSSSLQSQPAHGAPRTQLTMDARVGTPMFTDELAAKATFIHERGLQSASLRLSPEHLGPMEIQITIKDDKASVWFGATHAETRAALEQSLPRLREMLGSQGLSLSDAGVFREPPRDQARAYVAARTDGLITETQETDVVIRKRNGLLDAYA
jgi:flagellar hook-length control protein FliK